ncbi:uncharacterized protein LOC7470576 isoform X1 [Populus trichocarpa]|uniref:Uncharacterized protein n=2 Tax=Populus trichocarpa TaxID=3694 RepID=A0A2K2C009_POPTR|nr:uncharacterized protein LOC7470576 isoform X1 [Populus trichocarpa]|eukprot:XP_002299733.3 uncharacterized protein LOC7470576 isoform X1 [Populus trichocarpa]
MANICCSIEMEPRTLREGQLSHARVSKAFDLLQALNVSFFQEVAADVAQKMEPEEASDVFINGLRPVVSIKEMSQIEGNGDRHDHKVVECKEKTAEIIDRPCQCSCIPKDIESPDQLNLKEPLSAPF